MRSFPNIFVTVGTTQFSGLINALNSQEMATALEDVNCKKLTIQCGDQDVPASKHSSSIERITYNYLPSIIDDIRRADLVISHAGAGTCIDVLKHRKPLIVVVNDTLMHNHQIELAQQLGEEGVLVHCTPATLPETLKHFDTEKLKDYQRGDPMNFVRELDKLMGF
ncbi:UDP-N-acetylglucosamine transferase subunit ALG13 homolog [Lutzomyia longipalpis]|uniref:UDP-N-acetylglucosamine transferase subunit ALG13 homolog n=1 Tax=Lutzomyia longipalpis TaxID=7200 RepID=UPI0024835D25|nr:UDP-N-acetylglucosamine transferase subunit ALG13 homolog [Lutzomyia longipalpis]